MTITHTWSVKSLEYADTGDLASVVNHAKWVCFSDDGAGHNWQNTGSTNFAAPDHSNFTAFDTLTEACVLSWLGDEIVAGTEAVNVMIIQKLIDDEASNAGTGVPW